MELLTHGGEHHEISDDDDDGDGFSSLEPRTDSRSALPREIRACRRLRIVKRDESFSLIFFSPNVNIELELRSVEPQGAHEIGGAPSTLMDRVWPPGVDSFASNFYKFQKYSP